MKRFLVIFVCAAFAFAVAGFAWVRSDRVKVLGGGSARHYAQLAQPVFSNMAVIVPNDRVILLDHIKDAVNLRSDRLPKPLQTTMVDNLRKQVVDFLYYRFGQDDPLEYLRWRESLGCSFAYDETKNQRRIPVEEIAEYWGIEYQISPQHRSGLGTEDNEQLFSALWDAAKASPQHYLPIERIAVDQGGVQLAFGTTSSTIRGSTVVLGDNIVEGDYWYGGIGSTCPLWMRHTDTVEALARKYGVVYMAEAGVVAENSEGNRYPLILFFYWNPSQSIWQIEQISANNHITPQGMVPCPQF